MREPPKCCVYKYKCIGTTHTHTSHQVQVKSRQVHSRQVKSRQVSVSESHARETHHTTNTDTLHAQGEEKASAARHALEVSISRGRTSSQGLSLNRSHRAMLY